MNWHVSLRSGFAGVILTCTALLFVAGCDSNDDEDEFRLVTLTRYNQNVQTAEVNGEGSFEIEEDEDFKVDLDINGVFPEIRHAQFVQALGTCPTPEAADLNGDGFVDFQEGLEVFGELLIPLDSDLTDGDVNTFPFADQNGSYEYEEDVFFRDLLDAIGFNDDEDEGEEELDLENRTVVLYGVNPDTEFPDTVESENDIPVSERLPIACFEIERE